MSKDDTVTFYRDSEQRHRWTYTGAGNTLADCGFGYSRRIDCVRGACRVLGFDARLTQATVEEFRLRREIRRTRGHGHNVVLRIEATR